LASEALHGTAIALQGSSIASTPATAATAVWTLGDHAGTSSDFYIRRSQMTIGTILLIILILLLVGAIPSWPHSRSWGYGPSGIVGIVLVVVIVLLLMGRI
jgi:hypothetical protein